ncbi:unnamed protein product [Closterium sp. NIES-53]
MGADGRLVGLKRVLLVPGLCANLLSTKALSEAGMKMEMMGTKVFKATLDGRVLWDLRGGKDMHRSMWEIPVLPWKEVAACLAAEAVRGGHASHVTSGGGGDGSDGGLLVHGGGALPSRLQTIRSDRGGEFLGAEFRSWLKRHGIKQQLTTAYTPQSNGVAERANRTIIEGGRTILVDSGLPLQFWPLAIRHATVIKNRVLTHVGGQHWVPMDKWSGKMPLVDMLRVFGCMGLVHVPTEMCDKLHPAAVWAVHLGLARGSKGWLMWDPKSNTVFTTRDAKFMEGLMFKEWSERGRSKVTIPLGIEVGTNDPLLLPIELSSSSELTEVSHDLGGAEGEAADVEEVLQQGEALVAKRGDTEEEVQQPTPSPKLPPRHPTQGKRDAVRGGAKEGAAKERPKRAAQPRDFLEYERLGVPKALLVHEEEDEEEKGAEGEMEQICCFGAPTLRLLLAAAAVCGWKVEQMDVKTAFLYGVVDEEIYMKQPEGYDDGSGRVCRLNKAIYGLKQAPKCWYARLVEVLEALGFKVSGCDESLFMTEGEEEKVFLLVYVDDILLFSPSLERIKEVQGKLKKTFQCKALGPGGYYLGLHVERDEVKGWPLQEHLDAAERLVRYCMATSRVGLAYFTCYPFSSSEATAKAPLDEVFTRYPFSSSEEIAMAPLDEVVMDEVGPLNLGAAGAEYFLTMTWVYVLSKKSYVAEILAEGRKAITSKWLFKINSDADGKIERYKSRLVAKGYQQKEKVDYKELFAPVVKPTRLRTLLAGSTIKGWVVKQMDITTAFTNGILEEEIFMAQLEGFDDGSGRVWKLKKALYRLKQAPRQWYLKEREVLEEIGFTPSSADHSLFMLGEGEQRSFMVVYVDDIIIFSPSSELVKEVMLKLQDKFKCKALGDVSFYLGLHIERDVEKRCMRVHQRKYLGALAASFGQSEGHVATPFPSGFKCVKGPEEESVGEEERRRFHSLVGSLMYAVVNTRPDVSATGQFDRVVQCPNEEQVAAGMRVAKYLGHTGMVGLQYSAAAQRRQKGVDGVEPGHLFLTTFSDASYASEPENMTNLGGFICYVGGGPTSWESKKQVDQALSSVESEYMALFCSVREIVWKRRLLAKLGEEQQGPTPL